MVQPWIKEVPWLDFSALYKEESAVAFQTEFEFTLPRGYIDRDGNLHRDGVMRLANAADEILPLRDPRVSQNPRKNRMLQ